MEKLNPRLLADLKKWDPALSEEGLYALMPFDLPIDGQGKRIHAIAAFFKDELRVYNEGTLTLCMPMVEIERFAVISGSS